MQILSLQQRHAELLVVAHLGALEVVEPVDSPGQALLLRVVRLAGAHLADRGEAVVAFILSWRIRFSFRLVG
ncbi:hypothetical protein C9J49_004865 [Halomonas sp. SL1]|nr:hypothetical protein C9J49_004865 [Halomonas sp. SL1]